MPVTTPICSTENISLRIDRGITMHVYCAPASCCIDHLYAIPDEILGPQMRSNEGRADHGWITITLMHQLQGDNQRANQQRGE